MASCTSYSPIITMLVLVLTQQLVQPNRPPNHPPTCTSTLPPTLAQHHRLDLHSWCAASSAGSNSASASSASAIVPAAAARDIRSAVCPLSAIQDVPRVTMGGEDSNVYILNISGGVCVPGFMPGLRVG